MTNIKIKPLTKEQVLISVDRLTRFKHPEIKYLRVFKDILINNLIEPKFKKSDLDCMDYEELKNYAQEVFNYSLSALGLSLNNNFSLNEKLYLYEKSLFKFDQNVEKLLLNNLNYCACLHFIDDDCVKNLRWLKALNSDENILELREKNSFHFPIEKIIIVEGATEETLLPEFAKLCDYDFDKKGIHLIAAGGKNQVVKLYYELADTLRIPIFVLLDKDGSENAKEIEPKLRSCDKIHIINCGEFEDLLPNDLVKRTIRYELKNISILEEQNLIESGSCVKFLEEVFKNRGMHEFKKVEFAQMVKKNIQSEKDLSQEVVNVVDEIKQLNS